MLENAIYPPIHPFMLWVQRRRPKQPPPPPPMNACCYGSSKDPCLGIYCKAKKGGPAKPREYDLVATLRSLCETVVGNFEWGLSFVVRGLFSCKTLNNCVPTPHNLLSCLQKYFHYFPFAHLENYYTGFFSVNSASLDDGGKKTHLILSVSVHLL